MDFRDPVNRVNDLTLQVTDKLAFIAPLATRFVIGLAFFQAGSGKFRHFDNIVGFFQGIGIPFPAFNAGLVASMETVGGIMLILGLFTRFFASGLSITMVVALITADKADFLASWGSAAESPHRHHRLCLSLVPAVVDLLRRRQAEPRRAATEGAGLRAAGGRRSELDCGLTDFQIFL
jgi:uncharacterized membrane protein YphA (DoxX/SURF4 family)